MRPASETAARMFECSQSLPVPLSNAETETSGKKFKHRLRDRLRLKKRGAKVLIPTSLSPTLPLSSRPLALFRFLSSVLCGCPFRVSADTSFPCKDIFPTL